ncbi:insulinoma-associated protein 1a [Elysia marginata]|uniref:Insulinoma-associated protein 1a n=1 Tax=Elysia marginata TaxID=1093978 RepID=A0AAV4I8A3_9GAST|nr:insulinoma-associated protein 1a [Elysia marginata]
MVMPRHFLVKRYSPVDDAMNQTELQNVFQRAASEPGSTGETLLTTITSAALTNGSVGTYITDADQLNSLREDLIRNPYHIQHHNHHLHHHHHHLGEYTCHGSPDSGYAASPNSITHRDKDIIAVKKEYNNNNNEYSSSSSNSSNHYNKYQMSRFIGGIGMFKSHPYFNTHLNTRDISGSGSTYQDHIFLTDLRKSYAERHEYEDNTYEVPMDLSLPRKDRESVSPSSSPAQQEDITVQIPSSPPTKERTPTPAESAAIMYLNHLRGRGFCFPQSPPHPAYQLPYNRQELAESAINNYNGGEAFHASISNKDGVSCVTVSVSSPPSSPSPPPVAQRTQPSHQVIAPVVTLPTESTHRQKSPEKSSAPPPLRENTENLSNVREANRISIQVPKDTLHTRLKTPPSSPSSSSPSEDLSKSAPPLRSYITDINEKNSSPPNSTDSCSEHSTTTAATTPKPNASSSTSASSTQGTKLATAPVAGKKSSSGSRPVGNRRLKAVRKLDFDVDTTSPVSGTIIKDAADFHPEEGRVVYGDIEPSFNLVEVTPEARAELEKIDNKIGDYICQLCKEMYQDAFQLAQHRCSRIVHVEYRCPECEKVFNCPANLASHRRWHKPRATNAAQATKAPGKPQAAHKTAKQRRKGSLSSSKEPITSDLSQKQNVFLDIKETRLEAEATSSGSMAYRNGSLLIDTRSRHDCQIPTAGSPKYENRHGKTIVAEKYETAFSDNETSERFSKHIDFSLKPSSDVNFLKSNSHSSHISTMATSASKTLEHEVSGSSLTAEERSLVLQVLSSHNHNSNQQQKQKQPHHTTTTMATSTIMTPVISDFHEPKRAPGGGKRARLEDDHIFSDFYKIEEAEEEAPIDMSQKGNDKDKKEVQPYYLTNTSQTQAALTERPNNPQWKCDLCDKRFLRQSYLRKHCQTQHHLNQYSPTETTANRTLTQPSFQCENTDIFKKNCLKRPLASSHMKSHLHIPVAVNGTTISDPRNHILDCRVCGKTFSSEHARAKHETCAHGMPSSHVCSTCDSSFSSKTALEKHVRTVHAAEHFACKYCSSTFHSSPGLTRHINKCHPTENRQVILLQLPTSRPS